MAFQDSTNEVLVSTDSSAQLWSVSAWNPATGTQVSSCKGDPIAQKTLHVLSTGHVIGAANAKPLVYSWLLGRGAQPVQKSVCPDHVTALAVSPDENYCVGAIKNRIYIWQLWTGRLLRIVTSHLSSVTCLAFTNGGGLFVSGDASGNMMLWNLGRVLAEGGEVGHVLRPERTWSLHTRAVTSLHVGVGGARAWLASASLDRTVRLWSVTSDAPLLTLTVGEEATAVCLERSATRVACGTAKGRVALFSLLHTHTRSAEPAAQFTHHTAEVTALAMTSDGSVLASASRDCDVVLRNILDGNLIRKIPHKGQVTNLVMVPVPVTLSDPDLRVTCHPPALDRHVTNAEEWKGCAVQLATSSHHLYTADKVVDSIVQECIAAASSGVATPSKSKGKNKKESMSDEVFALRQEVERLRTANSALFQFSLDKFVPGDGDGAQ